MVRPKPVVLLALGPWAGFAQVAVDFRRRAMQEVVVVGDYLYIEGGWRSNWIDGELDKDVGFTETFNETLSISLTESWDNSTVIINAFGRDEADGVSSTELWADQSSGTIYRWGGWRSSVEVSEAPTLWALTPDSQGGGEWSSLIEENLLDARYAGLDAATAACGGNGFVAGGWATNLTDIRFESEDDIPLPGMLSYDMEAQTWSNISLVSLTPPYGTLVGATAQCATEIGPDPLLFVLGGQRTPAHTAFGDGGERSYDNITFYNVRTQTWHWQQATGDIPPGRYGGCSVSSQSQGSTYEIFVYGGAHPIDGILSTVHMLTIPAFHWSLVADNNVRRIYQACGVIGNGQMLVTGGLTTSTTLEGAEEPDEWNNGLGIFDMAALRWADSFDADALPYEAPDVARSLYRYWSPDDVPWNDGVREMFFAETSYTSSDDPEEAPSPPPGPEDSDESSETNVGAIAGGTVGGVVALILIVLAFWCFRRRRRTQVQVQGLPDAQQAELPGGHRELGATVPTMQKYNEVQGGDARYINPELDGQAAVAMFAANGHMYHQVGTHDSDDARVQTRPPQEMP